MQKETVGPPIRHFNIYRIKGGNQPEDVLRNEDDELQKIKLRKGVKGILYVRPSKFSEPPWVDFLRNATDASLSSLMNATTAAVLFLRAERKLFACCFGRGSAFLDPEKVKADFGLRVALNVVDPDKLRSIDVRAVDEVTLHTRRQSSGSTALYSFDVDVMGDMLRSVTGEPGHDGKGRESNVPLRVTGRDAIAFDARLEFSDLVKEIAGLAHLHDSRKYKHNFPWVDDVRCVRSKKLIDELDSNLLERLRERDTAGVHLTFPGIIDYAELSGYKFSTEAKQVPLHLEPEIGDYLETLGSVSATSLNQLHHHRIELHDESGSTPATCSVYRGLIAEITRHELTYILSAGEWYRIAKRLSAAVDEFLKPFAENQVELHDARPEEWEGAYNERMARELGYKLGDCHPVNPAHASSIEFCDLMTAQKAIIHVKRRSKSSALSHLFAQAYASAEAFLYDEEFRDQLRVKYHFGSLIPKKGKAPHPRDYEIAFAIIDANKENWPYSLPFLSKLSFRNVTERLRRLGYRVSLNRVDVKGRRVKRRAQSPKRRSTMASTRRSAVRSRAVGLQRASSHQGRTRH